MSESTEKRQLHLNYFHGSSGNHEAAWRHPDSEFRAALTLEHFVSLAKTAEAACFDSIFLPHGFGAFGLANTDYGLGLDPPLVLAAAAGHTSRVGLIGTRSTTFSYPYDVAQKFTTLDHLSNGRAGWNIVTSTTDVEARNFGMETLPEHDERYARAAEFVDTCLKLWDSWEDGALVVDKEAAVFADMDRVHEISHAGEYYAVQGPLSIPPSPQRYPLLVQAGASEAGKDFAARYAEAVFTFAPTMEDGQATYADMQNRLVRAGRPAGAAKIMPGFAPVIGATEEEARRRDRELEDLIVPERGLGLLEGFTRMDFSGHRLDDPVPPLPDLENFKGGVARMTILKAYVAREKPTLRQLAKWFANDMRGHMKLVGTAEQVADLMEEWLLKEAADGFNMLFPLSPGGLEEFGREVIPILQERGIFRSSYEGKTLRDHYGVPRPARATTLATAGG